MREYLCYVVSWAWGAESPFNLLGKVCLFPFAVLFLSVAVLMAIVVSLFEAMGEVFDVLFLKRQD